MMTSTELNAVDEMRQLARKTAALARAAESLLDDVVSVDDDSRVRLEDLAHLIDATAEAAAPPAPPGGWRSVRPRRRPPAFASLIARRRHSDDVPDISTDGDLPRWRVRPGPLEIAPRSERAGETPRIVDEYTHDATVEL